MRIFKLAVALPFLFSIASRSLGSEIAYTFQGTVTTAGTVFGQAISLGAVSGHFAYNTSSVGVPIPSFPSVKYTHHRTQGLVVTFGGAQFSADDYFVVVSDNFNQPVVGIVDEFEIYFQGNKGLPSALMVNGVDQDPLKGLLRVALRFPSATFSSTSLPASLNSANLVPVSQAKFGPVNDFTNGAGPPPFPRFRVDSFSLTTLPAEVPEPGSVSLAIAALTGTWIGLRMYKGRRGR